MSLYGLFDAAQVSTRKMLTEYIEEQSRKAALKAAEISGGTFAKDLSERISTFFSENPEFNTLVWEQYTTEWNDGEECNFGLHNVTALREITLNEQDAEALTKGYAGDREGSKEIYNGGLYNFLYKNEDSLKHFFEESTVIVTRENLFIQYRDIQNVPQGTYNPYGE